jgi:hypothetical protein
MGCQRERGQPAMGLNGSLHALARTPLGMLFITTFPQLAALFPKSTIGRYNYRAFGN